MRKIDVESKDIFFQKIPREKRPLSLIVPSSPPPGDHFQPLKTRIELRIHGLAYHVNLLARELYEVVDKQANALYGEVFEGICHCALARRRTMRADESAHEQRARQVPADPVCARSRRVYYCRNSVMRTLQETSYVTSDYSREGVTIEIC